MNKKKVYASRDFFEIMKIFLDLYYKDTNCNDVSDIITEGFIFNDQFSLNNSVYDYYWQEAIKIYDKEGNSNLIFIKKNNS